MIDFFAEDDLHDTLLEFDAEVVAWPFHPHMKRPGDFWDRYQKRLYHVMKDGTVLHIRREYTPEVLPIPCFSERELEGIRIIIANFGYEGLSKSLRARYIRYEHWLGRREAYRNARQFMMSDKDSDL